MARALQRLFITSSLLFIGVTCAFAQPTFSITNVKDACAGLNNGSFDVNILTANGSVTLLIFGPPNFNRVTSVGQTESFTGLKPQNYLVIAQDADGNNVQFQPIANIPVNISFSGAPTAVNNSSCSSPNGSITIFPTGGNGGPYNYAWTGPGAFTANTQNLANLAGGNYVVTVTDPTANCSFTSGPIAITDPSPLVQTVTTPSPENTCLGDPAVISLASSQPLSQPLSYYEILNNGSPTGVRVNGSGGPISLILPSGSFANGDVLTVLAVDDLCAPTLMNGSVTLSVHTPPSSATLSGTASICTGQSTNLSVAIVGGTGPFSFNITNLGPVAGYTSGNPLPVTPGATTTYTLGGLVIDANGCSVAGAGSATVTVTPLPTATILASPAAICAGQGSSTLTFTLTGTGPFNVNYSDGSGSFSLPGISTGHTVAVSPAATTTYTISSIIDATTLCVGIPGSNTTVNVNSPPSSATLNLPGPDPICAGQSTFLSVTIVGGTSPYDFTIPGVPPQVGYTSGSIITVTPPATTPYVLGGVTVTDAKGCTVTGTGGVIVAVNPLPTATLSAAPGAICAGQGNSTLTFTMTGSSPYNIIYSDGTSSFNLTGIASGHTVVVSPAVTTTYEITSIQDATSCFGVPSAPTNTATVTVNSPPTSATLSLAGADPICAGQSSTLQVVIVGGASPYDFTITGLGAQTAYVSGTPITVTPAVTTTFILSGLVTDAGGCTVTGTGSVPITVNPLPTATVSGGGTVCSGAPLPDVTFTFTGTAPFDFSYSDGTTTTSVFTNLTNTFTITNAPAGTYSVTALSDNDGCSGASFGTPVSVVVDPLPTAVISGTASMCAGGATLLSFALAAGTYDVVYTDGTSNFTLSAISNGATASVSPALSTTYTIISVTSTATTCSSTAPSPNITGSAAITVNALPTALVSGGGQACFGSPAPDVTFNFTGTAPFTFTYTDGTTPVTIVSHPAAVFTISTPPAGTYSITGLTDGNGCFGTSLGSAVAVSVNPLPTASIAGTTSICSGGSTALTFNLAAGTYDVVYTDGTSNFTLNAISDGATATVVPAVTTSYTIVSVTNTVTTCSVTAPHPNITGSADVTVIPSPTAVISGGGIICSGSPLPDVTFTFTGTAPFDFSYSDGTTTTSVVTYLTNTFTITNAPAGAYSVTALSDNTGCSGSSLGTPVTVIVNPLPTASISGGGTVCAGSPLPDVTFTFTGTAPFDFSYSDGTTTTSVFTHLTNTFTISNAPAGTYSVTALSDNSGCGGTSLGTPVTVTSNPLPTASVSGGGTVCSSSPLPNVDFTFTGTPPFNFSYSDGTTTTPVVAHPSTTFTVSNAAAGTYSMVSLKDNTGCLATSLGSPVNVIVTPVATGVLSGSTAICVGSSASLTITLTGSQPWDVTMSDGSGTFPVNGIAASPFTLVVNPLISTTYTLVSVTDAACGAGTANGTATVTVNPIAGNPATFGIDTWLGYVFDDSGDPTPLPARINFSNPKYRGFIDENDIAGMSPLSSYNTVTDEFDLNISDNPSGFTVHSSNLCGSFNDNFSIRYRMRKTFAQGVFTFTVGSDDGVRLFLDGVSIIPGAFVNQPYATYTSAAQCISAGQHDLVIEYYENTSFSRLTFNYQAAPAPAVTTPVTTCINSSSPTLTASSIDPGVIGFNWYKDAALTTLLFSGANFTPLAADLDMTVAATTSFFATAVYACGETTAAQVDVNVVTTAVITPPTPPTQICQSAGIVDLTTLVSAVPSGGTFTFSGTGVTTSPNFDPTLVTGSTTITTDYISGTCAASINFNIDVVTVAVITVPASPVAACQASGLIDMTTLVSATPAGGTFTFTGSGVTGINFDPSAQSGAVPITVDYNAGGCTDSQTLTFNVTATATLTISNPTVCPAAGTVNLTTLVNAVPGGGTFTFTGSSVVGNTFDPSGHAGSIVAINVDYDQGGCIDSGTINITVRNAADPLCGSASNCNVFTVTITDTRPSCSNQNDGVININVSGGSPNYVVTLTDGGAFNQALLGPGPLFTFANLSPANYQYIIQDGAGNVCSLPHSLPITATVQATASGFVDALCFNQPVGGATVTVNSGGAAPYEYSIDGGTSWIVFTSPITINNLMPSAAPYSILVRDDASDICPAQVMVTINNAVTDISATITITDATCANNDGSIQIGAVTGGTPPYTYVLDGVNFASLPVNNTFTALSGGAHLFTVVDANSCRKDFPISIAFPGLVNFTTSVIDPDCTGNGTNGQLTVTITSVGSFQVGISTDPLSPPPSFQNVASAGSSSVTFNNLGKGTYYVTAKSVNAQCPTVSSATLAGGPVAVDFLLTADDILCFENKGGVTLKNIHGSPTVNYTYRILNFGIVVQSGVISTLQAVADVPLTGLDKGDYSIQLTQDQSAATGCASPITSAFNLFTVQGPTGSLDTLSVQRTISLPDQATGSMLIGIQESGQEPYEVRLELTQPIFPTQFYLLDWSPAARNPHNLKIEFSATNLFAGEYKLSLRDALGCEKDYAVSLKVDTDVFIPNIFTPNNDGFNDVFYIRNKPAGTNVFITNRWGKEVYRSGDYNNDWSGGNLEDGIYYYSIQAGGQTFNGWLEIQRSLGQ